MKTVCKQGNYTKFLNYGSSTILSYVAKNENDNYHKVLTDCRGYNKDINGFQCCESEEEFNNFNKVLFVHYNVYGEPLNNLLINFDFNNNTITFNNGKSYKVKECNDYVYKIQKTQIKANEGVKGLYKHIIKTLDIESPLHGYTFNMLETISNK